MSHVAATGSTATLANANPTRAASASSTLSGSGSSAGVVVVVDPGRLMSHSFMLDAFKNKGLRVVAACLDPSLFQDDEDEVEVIDDVIGAAHRPVHSAGPNTRAHILSLLRDGTTFDGVHSVRGSPILDFTGAQSTGTIADLAARIEASHGRVAAVIGNEFSLHAADTLAVQLGVPGNCPSTSALRCDKVSDVHPSMGRVRLMMRVEDGGWLCFALTHTPRNVLLLLSSSSSQTHTHTCDNYRLPTVSFIPHNSSRCTSVSPRQGCGHVTKYSYVEESL